MRVILLSVPVKRPDQMMSSVRIALRALFIVLHIMIGVILSLAILWPLSWVSASFSWKIQSWIIRLWNRVLCLILGLQVTREGARFDAPVLFVANHISWLDIVGLLAYMDGVFLAKSEVRSWPVIGWLCNRAGTLFIARGAVGAADRACKQIRKALLSGKNVFIFPEGTSTNGRLVRPFFPRLFEAAIRTEKTIQPVAIKYRRNGRVDEIAPFIDEDEFTVHLLRLIAQPKTNLSISYLPPIESDSGDRRTLAKAARTRIEEVVLSEENEDIPVLSRRVETIEPSQI